jgi:hypothetical protein
MRSVWKCEGAVVILGGLHMSTHTLGKHSIWHTSRLQHGVLGSHLSIFSQIKGANKAGKAAEGQKAGSRQPANI